jgi:hypothetical protein
MYPKPATTAADTAKGWGWVHARCILIQVTHTKQRWCLHASLCRGCTGHAAAAALQGGSLTPARLMCLLFRLLLLQDLARAQVHAADAVFIMADKSPGDAHEE